MKRMQLRRADLFYPELSYQIVGMLFGVSNELGSGHHEKYYQRAIVKELETAGLKFCQQISFPVRFKGAHIGRSQLDFIVEDKIVLEIKKGNKFSKRHIDQVLAYLKESKLRLAILANFSAEGVSFRRIVNFSN